MEKYVLNLTRNHYNIYDANQEAFLDMVRGDVDPTAVKIVRPTSSTSKKGGTLTKLQLSLNRLTWRRKNNSSSNNNYTTTTTTNMNDRNSTTAASAAAVEMTEGVYRGTSSVHHNSPLSPVSNPIHTTSLGGNNSNSSLMDRKASSINGSHITTTATTAAVVQSISEGDSDDEAV